MSTIEKNNFRHILLDMQYPLITNNPNAAKAKDLFLSASSHVFLLPSYERVCIEFLNY